ncbi:DUF736 domain-containing protein [Hyphococcus luteus]|uniref:DUF736 domain-containing protein n=1 Tax=Hyphococcus luteus TaxID=2058213 RepID=A0A2S7K9Q9_9PROT|nr:DUF736 domain-containing protein [Marinicaulis flavus]PQA89227.1 DUF736 domain-containing protein [Marinicaulis flavus]
MSIIGTFSKTADGYAGLIRTMTINVKAKIVANDKKGNDKAPDFKIFAGGAELGAAWRAKGNGDEANDFLRVELDDPSFAAPIRAALFENPGEDKAALVWSRK